MEQEYYLPLTKLVHATAGSGGSSDFKRDARRLRRGDNSHANLETSYKHLISAVRTLSVSLDTPDHDRSTEH